MQTKKYILILARKGILLYSSSLAGLLSRETEFHVDVIEEEIQEFFIGRQMYRHDLVIYFADSPTATFASRIVSLCGKDAKLLLVLGSEEKLAIRHLKNLEVDGVISTGATYSELLTAIHTLVIKNLKYISPLLIASFTGPPIHDPFSCLSRKELDIALSVTDGKRNVEIAIELNISPKTVNTYKSRIYRKLGITNNMQLLKLTLRMKEPRMN